MYFFFNLSLKKVAAGSLGILLLSVFLHCLHKYIYWMLSIEKEIISVLSVFVAAHLLLNV